MNKWETIETDDAKRPNLRVVFTDERSSEDWEFFKNVGLPHGIILVEQTSIMIIIE